MSWKTSWYGFDNEVKEISEKVEKIVYNTIDYSKDFDAIDAHYAEHGTNGGSIHDIVGLIHSEDPIVLRYRKMVRWYTRDNKSNRQMQAILDGNKEWYGHAQDTFEQTKYEIEKAELKLKIEKEVYLKLYEKNRELESKLYLVERELEILKGEAKL